MPVVHPVTDQVYLFIFALDIHQVSGRSDHQVRLFDQTFLHTADGPGGMSGELGEIIGDVIERQFFTQPAEGALGIGQERP